MGGKFSRDKGKRGERMVVEIFQTVMNKALLDAILELNPDLEPKQAKEKLGAYQDRNIFVVQRNTLQSDRGGCDLVGTEDISVEVKYQERLQIKKWWEQTVKQTYPGNYACLCYKTNSMLWKFLLAEPRTLDEPKEYTYGEFCAWLYHHYYYLLLGKKEFLQSLG